MTQQSPPCKKPSLALDKSASPSNYDSVGDVIVYSYLLTNNGNVTLDGPFTVSDDKIANVTCPATATLAPTASITCTANYTIKQTDLDAGSITNVASASNGTVTSPTDKVTVTADQMPSLALEKSALPIAYDSVGDVIVYSYLVTNTGNVTLSGPFTVSDNKIADVTCPATATLAPGISITCTASYTIKQTDLDAGSITNVASASNGTVTSPTDEATVTADQMPSLALDKSALPIAYDSVGDVIVYSYLVTNNGNVTLSGPFTVSDNKIATVTCPATATLAPGASITCTASYTITQSDLDAGSITNVASASNGTVTSPTDTATVTAGQNPALLITKSPDLQHVFVGELATFTIMVTNIGNVTLTDVNVTDPLSPSCNRTIGTMIPGATVEYTCTVSVTADFVNKATATGKDPKGNSVSDDDTATVDAQKASITINKQIAQSASGPWSDALNTIFAGTSVYYQFVVVNTGDVALSGITVNDPKLGGVMTCPKTTLAAGESMTCSVVGPITATYSNGSSVINTATVTGCADAAHCATDDDTAAYSASYWGFTPGFWKNHAKAGSRYMWSYTAYSPSQKVNTVFTIPSCISSKYGTNTLLQALGLKGGSTLNGAAEILLRAATASLLNASFHETYNHAVYLAGVGLVDNLANPTIVYWPYSSQQIIAMVNSALASCNRSTILQLAATLDGYNNGIHQTPWGGALTAAEVAALNVPDAAEGEEQAEETEAKFSIFLPTVLK